MILSPNRPTRTVHRWMAGACASLRAWPGPMLLRLVGALLFFAPQVPARAQGPVASIVIPPTAVPIPAGANAQSIVNAHPPGTTYVFASGLHRLQQIIPRNGDRFIGAPGARLNGAQLLTRAVRLGGGFVFEGVAAHPRAERHGLCQPQYPRCDRPQALFVDDQPLRAVARLEDVAPGRWFFDEERRRVHLADDPAGRVVEMTHTPFAFGGNARDVIIENLTVEKYGSTNQRGAINHNGAGLNWRVRNNDVLRNYGMGINLGSGNQAIGNRANYNGQLGMGGGTSSGILVQGNEIAFNVWNGVDCEWECGGAKWGAVTDLVLADNHVHNNAGVGLWTDESCRNVVFAGNLIERNARAGISHEISYRAVIRNNRLIANGTGGFTWGWHGQIQVQNSLDVEVHGNVVELDPVRGGNGIILIQQDRGAAFGLRNIAVTGNVLRMRGGDGTLAGWFADFEAGRVPAANIRFESNQYFVFSLDTSNDAWSDNDSLTFSQWQAAGFDRHGAAVLLPP